MAEKEVKKYPECITKKLISLREEGISQDIHASPVLIFLRVAKDTPLSFERILKTVIEEAFPFKAEIYEVYPYSMVICFDAFKTFAYQLDDALTLARRLSDLNFVEVVFISKARGFFRYANIKGREFVVMDIDAFYDFFKEVSGFEKGVYLDESSYSCLYHNVIVEVVGERYLKVNKVRKDYIFHPFPQYEGKNPISTSRIGSGAIILRGKKGSGKTHAALDSLFSKDLDMIAHVKLYPYMQFEPLSAMNFIARAFEFYIDRKESAPLEFVKMVLKNKGKKAVFIENAEYMDADTRKEIETFLNMPESGKTLWILEGAYNWEKAEYITFNEFSGSFGLRIFKALSGYKKPDKTLMDFIDRVSPQNYTHIFDIFAILSFKKYLIFGEDTVYLSPLAISRLGSVKNMDSLYEEFFRSLSNKEEEALLSIALNYGVSYNLEKYFYLLVRMSRHSIVRLGPRIEILSREIRERILKRAETEKIKAIIERGENEFPRYIKMWQLELMGEKRAIFRELKRFKNSVGEATLSRHVILNYLLRLEPTEKEKIDILLELKDWATKMNEIQKAQEYVKEAIKVAKELKDVDILANVLYVAGVFNATYGQMGQALMYLKDARKFAEKSGQRKLMIDILLKMARIYMRKNDHDKVIETLGGIEEAELTVEKRAEYLFLLATAYMMHDNLNRAYSLLKEALSLMEDFKNNVLRSEILTKMAEVEFAFGNVQVAGKYAENAISYNLDNMEAKLILAKTEFKKGNIKKSLEILNNLRQAENNIGEKALLELAVIQAYLGHYKSAISNLDVILKNISQKSPSNLNHKVLINKARYLLRLGRYKKAWDIIQNLDNVELLDEFYLFLMGREYTPKRETPYIRVVMSFTTLKDMETLDSTLLNDYDYIDAKWMLLFTQSLKELMSGNYERAYDIMRGVQNGYFKASLLLNIARYVINRGGDGDPFLKEAGELAEKEDYLEVLFWIYIVLGKRDKAFRLFDQMFEDNIKLREKYINSRSKILK